MEPASEDKRDYVAREKARLIIDLMLHSPDHIGNITKKGETHTCMSPMENVQLENNILVCDCETVACSTGIYLNSQFFYHL